MAAEVLGGTQQKGKAAVLAGGVVVDVLHSGDLVAWSTAYDLHISVVKPKDGETLSQLVSREWTYVIDLKTMKIVWKGFGSYSGGAASTSTMTEGLNQLMTLLGK
ncbi:MAG: hypothetical protein HS104_09315 [Polyangiaceae bacterium]|nr:hypothetical protein [Polyangiaceae bacterium]MCE7893816.1 hypothetical protein [Sorangiineae bacterium PRO1]MCL4754098.1 hypothetical protein [Myxococcales bacterium]